MNKRTMYRTASAALTLFVLALLSFSTTATAQPLPSLATSQGGKTYIISFPDTVRNTFDPRYPPTLRDKVQLFLYATVDTKVAISSGGGGTVHKVLTGGSFEAIDLISPPITTEVDTPSNATVRLDADNPIIVYCYFVTRFGCEAFTAIPVEAWGTEYAVASSPGETVRNVTPGDFKLSTEKVPAPEEALILAAFDSTTVTIGPAAKLVGLVQPISIHLDAGQSYLVQSLVDTSDNAQPISIAGSRIVADKPIGVISGNTRAQVTDQEGITRNSFKNAMIEWLPPTDQHGTEFVYMPTWDEHRPIGVPNEKLEEKRQAEYIRIYGTVGDVDGSFVDSTGNHSFTITAPTAGAPYDYYLLRQDKPTPVYFKTDGPAMAMMNSSSVVKFSGSPTPGSAAYDAKGAAYMVEMTPREQWVGFAPFVAPIAPPNMNHYINVVTDTASLDKVVFRQGVGVETKFTFNRGKIPGSDLVWGTMQVVPGTSYYLRGLDSSVRFYGFVYGMLPGYELLRPSNLSEYEENIALAYGYPLAPLRRVSADPDSLVITTQQFCGQLTANIRAVGSNPAGLRSIEFADGATNAKLVFADPGGGAISVLRKTQAMIGVLPIDPHLDASATIVVTDRTGHETRIPYSYTAEKIDIAPTDLIDFGEVEIHKKSHDTVVTICNPLDQPLTVTAIRLAFGSQRFALTDTNSLPLTLPAKGCLNVSLSITPTVDNKLYTDSLLVLTTCNRFGVMLRAETVTPCLYVDDLSFGSVSIADSSQSKGKTLPLKLCNQGRGRISFKDEGSGILSWLDQNHFTVDQADIDLLSKTVLGPGECVTIEVTFLPTDIGVFRTVGHFSASTDNCRDTSVWSATVISSTTDVPADIDAGFSLRAVRPNPFVRRATIEFSLGNTAPTTVEIFAADGRKVVTILDGTTTSGQHSVEWDAAGNPAGLYYCRVSSGHRSASVPLILLR